MPRAIKLTEENIPRIIEDAKKLQFDLRHIESNVEYNREFGWETYLITDGDKAVYNNITFTEFADVSFHQIWKFAHPESPKHFVKIERV